MSFRYKTSPANWHVVLPMKKDAPFSCPFESTGQSDSPLSPRQFEAGEWPPGPPSGVTGWSLSRKMSHNMLETLSEWKQAFGKVFHLRIWPENFIVLTDPELARELLVNHHDALIRWERGIRVFAKVHGHSVIIAEGEKWIQKRQVMQPNFTPRALQSTIPSIIGATRDALDSWPPNDDRWPIESAFTSLTMDAIIRTMFSTEVGDEARQAAEAVRVVGKVMDAEFFSLVNWPDWVPWKLGKRRAIQKLDELIERHMQERLQAPEKSWPDDLLSRLLRLQQTNPSEWSYKDIRDECMTTFLAGHETTAATLTWWAWCMASNPTMQEKARTEVAQVLQGEAPTMQALPALSYLARTLDETMRLYPAAPVLMTRRAVKPVSLGPWQFPQRTLFMLPIQLMQRDSSWFTDPQDYWPDRFNDEPRRPPRGAYAPFGLGPRVCLGQHLATAEMKVMAAMILQRWTLSIPAGMKSPRPVQQVALRPDEPLHLSLRSVR
ncbi:cytochrome P450 [Achromobacter sp. PD1]|uniref:cytochrome P450 n=1 Tax=Achromobacter sp. PD1 TaxID=3399125 RepID=UPI003AF71377